MAQLGGAIVESIVMNYGRSEFVRRISDPLWFQSFGAVLGMDWHSSGITTSVMGALKKSINVRSNELGIYICGGRGRHSRKTPSELLAIGEKTGLNADHLVRCSRLSAKIDSTAIQDGFQIYLHNFIVTDTGEWAVVQQGMNDQSGYARRYHWHSKQMQSFVNDPHTAVCGSNQGLILNLAHLDAHSTRQGTLDITNENPSKMIADIRQIEMPAHHDVKIKDVDLKRLGAVLALAYESDIQDFESLLLLRGLGPRTLQSLVLVSEVVHGTPSRFSDPARFSFAHGGKDGHPFPVPTKVYDEVIEFMNTNLIKAKINHTDKQKAFKKLHEMAKKIEDTFKADGSKYEEWIDEELKNSSKYGGMTVMGDAKTSYKKMNKTNGQLSLFD